MSPNLPLLSPQGTRKWGEGKALSIPQNLPLFVTAGQWVERGAREAFSIPQSPPLLSPQGTGWKGGQGKASASPNLPPFVPAGQWVEDGAREGLNVPQPPPFVTAGHQKEGQGKALSIPQPPPQPPPFVPTGHWEVVRAAGPAGDRHPAADDHPFRGLHPGEGLQAEGRGKTRDGTSPKRPQNAPKTSPKCPQNVPKRPQNVPQTSPECLQPPLLTAPPLFCPRSGSGGRRTRRTSRAPELPSTH